MLISKRYVICGFAFIAYSFVSVFQANSNSVTEYITIFGDRDVSNGTTVYRYFGRIYTDGELRRIKTTARMGSLMGAGCAVVSGALATRYGGSSVFGIGMLVNSINNLLTPFAFAVNLELFILARFVNGVSHMLSFCAMSDVWSRWSPIAERSRLVVFAQLGLFASVFFHHLISNWIAYASSWPWVFYVTGIGGAVWAILWLYYVKNDPDQDDRLSDKEKDQLAGRLNFVESKRAKLKESPWKTMLSSAPVWALGASALLLNNHTIFTYILVLHLKVEKHVDNTIIANVKQWMAYSSLLSLILAGWLADHLRNEYKLTDTKIRKGYICSAYLFASLLLCAIWFSPTTIAFAVFFSAYEFCRSVSDAAILVNVIDISPKYSSFLNGLYQTLVAIGSVLHRRFIQDTIENNELAGFEFCLVLYFLLYMGSAILYHLWGSAEPQQWNPRKRDNNLVELM